MIYTLIGLVCMKNASKYNLLSLFLEEGVTNGAGGCPVYGKKALGHL